jgi:hypothetical protein
MKTSTLAKLASVSSIVGVFALAACANNPPTSLDPLQGPTQGSDDPTTNEAEKPGAFSGGQSNTFDHMASIGGDSVRDPFDILAQRQEEGPPEIRTRLHSCQKMRIASIRNLLVGLGVDMKKTSDPPSAGELLAGGATALGGPNFDARVGEALVWSSAGAAKLFDIFVQAAPEIIANLPTAPLCQDEGGGPAMFDAQSKCNPDAIACLIGRPATAEHVAICNSLVNKASDKNKGKAIAVATLLAAAHSCE